MMTSTAMGKSSVIRIREPESLSSNTPNHPHHHDSDDSDDDCSNPFMTDDVCADSVLRCSSISSLTSHDSSPTHHPSHHSLHHSHHHVHHVHHHVHHSVLLSTSASPSSAVKKDVNLSSTSCIEVIKRESALNRNGHGLRGSSSHHLNTGHPSSLLNSASTLDRYCESPSFLLDSTTDSSPSHPSVSSPSIGDHSSHHSHHHNLHVHGHHHRHASHHSGHHHSHHHLVVGSDDDGDVDDVDESSNDVHESIVSGRVSRMSTETVPDTDLMFSCSGVLGSVDPRDVTVVTPSSIMGDSIVADDSVVGVTGVSPVNIVTSVTSSSPAIECTTQDGGSLIATTNSIVNVVNGTGVHSNSLIGPGVALTRNTNSIPVTRNNSNGSLALVCSSTPSTTATLITPVTVNGVTSSVLTGRTLNGNTIGTTSVTGTLNGIQGHNGQANCIVTTASGSISTVAGDQVVSHSVMDTHSIVGNGNVVVGDVDDDDDPLDSFDIKQEKLDDVDDVTECILKDPPLNHLKTSPCRSFIVSSVQRPVVVTTCASSSGTLAANASANANGSLNHNNTNGNNSNNNNNNNTNHNHNNNNNNNNSNGRVLPDSSTTSVTVSTNDLITNGVSSTTSLLSPVISNDRHSNLTDAVVTVNRSSLATNHNSNNLRVSSGTTVSTIGSTVQSTTPTAVVLATHGSNNVTNNATLVASSPSISSSGASASTNASNSPLDIKILPAGLIQLASNLAAVFPASNLHKQQIAIQLLREDGTSIILPIATRGTTAVTLNANSHSSSASHAVSPNVSSNGVATSNSDGSNTVSILTSPALHGLTLKPTETVLVQTTNGTVTGNNGANSNNLGQTAIITTAPLLTTATVKPSDVTNVTNSAGTTVATSTANGSSSNVSTESDRPFKCELCNSTFTRLGNYTRHKKIHSLPTKEDQRFRCDICSKSFIQRCDLARHLHIHRGTEPHRCPQCGKGYIRHSDLVTHQRFHNKEKPFACPHCSKGFCQRGDLNRHLRSIHLQLKPILCTHCHKKFAKEETLLRHINSTHRDKLLDN